MPLDDSTISKESDGSFNEKYCKWCYANGDFTYKDIDTLINFLSEHMSNENFSKEQAKTYFEKYLPKLEYWNNNK